MSRSGMTAIVIAAFLLSSCASQMAMVSGGTISVTGAVAKNWAQGTPAVNQEVKLVDSKTGKVVETTRTNWAGSYGFGGVEPGNYTVHAGRYKQNVKVSSGNNKVNFDLSEPDGVYRWEKQLYQGVMQTLTQYTQGGGGTSGSSAQKGEDAPASSVQGGAKAAPAAGPTDSGLMQKFTGNYWGYSGSTEMKMAFCPNGTFREFSESSYSGRGFDSGGSQTMAWGSASQGGYQGTWAITGNISGGTLTIRYSNGKQRQVPYRAIDNQGCYQFGNDKLCRTGPASCN